METVSSSDEGNWSVGGDGEGSTLVLPGIRKKSLRNITPRSYSSLLKSESEEDEEEQENKADKPKVAPAVKPSKWKWKMKHVNARVGSWSKPVPVF